MQRIYRTLIFLLLIPALSQPAAPGSAARSAIVATPYPILFVTQVPIRQDFTTIGSTFGNHLPGMQEAGRGGDLWIRYPDGTLRNLTAAAGFGMNGFQGAGAIAVRDPAVHWSGTKAIFSMVIGAPTQQYQWQTYYWQLYEVSGFLDPQGTVTITKVPKQPANFNNIYPLYAADGRILFVSDRPRSGAAHLYPQRDEYELAPTNTGIWSLDPVSGELRLLNHAPSGDFSPMIDSFGRLLFTQWDHLQRDQQADSDSNYAGGVNDCGSGSKYGTFNYSDESAAAVRLGTNVEVFPEPRGCRSDLLAGTNLEGHSFNQFFPWTMRQDGSESEVLNHLGRHEFQVYSNRSLTNDPNVVEFYGQYGSLYNQSGLETGFFQITEDPLHPGEYYGVDTPEFGTHAAGMILRISAPPSTDADHIAIQAVTHPDTYGFTNTANHSGRYREPLLLSDGTLVAVHTSAKGEDANSGPSLYDFRLKTLALGGNGYYSASQPLTGGIVESISFWDPDTLVTYNGPLWELNPVEVRPRTPTAPPAPALPAPETQIFTQAGVDPALLQDWLRQNNLALVISRNVTTRDDLDRQQPFNLRVPGGVQTTGAPGKIYDLGFMQFFQADQLRGFTGCCSNDPNPGRRVLAQPLHDPAALAANPITSGPAGSVVLAKDGSMAAFVPARRALTWQLTDPVGTGVIRERYWLTFQPGEMRVCTSCHGLSSVDQAGHTAPVNPPQALLALLEYWKSGAPTPSAWLYLPLAQK